MASKVSTVHVILSGFLVVLFGAAGAVAQAVDRSKTLDGFGESRRGDVPEGTAEHDDAKRPTRPSRTAWPGWPAARTPTARSAAGPTAATSR